MTTTTSRVAPRARPARPMAGTTSGCPTATRGTTATRGHRRVAPRSCARASHAVTRRTGPAAPRRRAAAAPGRRRPRHPRGRRRHPGQGPRPPARLQDPRGWWIGELETNVTMDAEDVLLRHFLGILTEVELAETAGWIRSQQRADGTWANFYGGPGDLSTTVEAYVALKLAGDPVDAPHMKRAADWITASGGAHRDPGLHQDLARPISGLWSWDDLPGDPARGHLPAVLGPAEHLRLGLLGQADDRRAGGGRPASSRAGRCRSRSTSCYAAVPGLPPKARAERTRGRWRSTASTRRCTRSSRGCPSGPGGPPGAAAPTGSSPARRPTAAGAASSRRGCTRSWRCT